MNIKECFDSYIAWLKWIEIYYSHDDAKPPVYRSRSWGELETFWTFQGEYPGVMFPAYRSLLFEDGKKTNTSWQAADLFLADYYVKWLPVKRSNLTLHEAALYSAIAPDILFENPNRTLENQQNFEYEELYRHEMKTGKISSIPTSEIFKNLSNSYKIDDRWISEQNSL